MNRIVREHYPVSKLPEDLREGFEGQAEVRVTVDAVANPSADVLVSKRAPSNAGGEDLSAARSVPGPFSRFRHVHRANYATIEDAVAYVRALRDEWSDRER